MPMVTDFNKFQVMATIERYSKSPPTPTDAEHQAEWWNEPFGQRIRNEMFQHLQNLKSEINAMRLVPR